MVGLPDLCTLCRAVFPVDNCLCCTPISPVNSTWRGIDIYKRVDYLVVEQVDAMTRLQERCLDLPYIDRLNLCEALWKSILQERQDGRPTPADRGEILLREIGEIVGEPVLVKSRKAILTWARAMVAYQLLKEGYSTTEAGRAIGRDHSTIIHLRDRMEDVFDYPVFYKDVIELWITFQKRIQDETDKGTTQHSLPMGGEFPDCNQSAMGKESGEQESPGDL